MKNLSALTKLIRCIFQLLAGIWTIFWRFGNADEWARQQMIAQWAREFLSVLDVRVQTHGLALDRGPLLVVSNHISWLDILVLLSVQPVRFVSKSEVRRWPLIGWLATNVGTLYIERSSRRDAMRVVGLVADALRSGQIIAVFPEGTTTDGSQLLPFHGNLMQSAIDANCPIQGVVLRYSDAALQERSLASAYVDDDTLLSSVWRLLKANAVVAHANFLTPVHEPSADRRALARRLHQQMLQVLDSEPKVTT